MSKLQELIKKRADYVKQMNEIVDKADAEKRDFNADEQRTWDEIDGEVKTLTRRIERENTLVSLNSGSTQSSDTVKAEPAGETRTQQTAQKATEQNANPWRSFGEFLTAVAKAGLPGGRRDARLFECRDATGLNEGVGSEGGFFVQKDFAAELLQRTFQTGILASKVRRIPISGNGVSINAIDESSRVTGSRYGGVQVFWVGEGGTVTPKKPKFRQINMKVHKLMGLAYITEENLEDAPLLDSIVSDAFRKEMAYVVDDAILNGDGSAKPIGIMNSGALVTVNKESGQAADTVVKDNLAKMRARLLAVNRANSVWFINQDVEPQLQLLTLGDLGAYFPAGTFANQPLDQLWGRPVQPIEQCATLGDLGDIVLADLSEYLWIDKGDIKQQTSIHVRFDYDEMVFKFTYRADGQPWIQTPLTPAKGTNTLSPFVTLQARA